MQGKLIAFEGIDGSGKSTQSDLFLKYLDQENVSHSFYKFPQYEKTFHGRTITRFLNGEFGSIDSMSSHLIALAYAMDRATAKEAINKDFDEDKLVVLDRYVYSSGAFQGAKFPEDKQAEFIKWLEELEYQENKMPKETLNILFDIPVNFAVELLNKTDKVQDIHEKALDFLERVRALYLKLAKNENWAMVEVVKNNQLRTPEDIHEEVLSILKDHQII